MGPQPKAWSLGLQPASLNGKWALEDTAAKRAPETRPRAWRPSPGAPSGPAAHGLPVQGPEVMPTLIIPGAPPSHPPSARPPLPRLQSRARCIQGSREPAVPRAARLLPGLSAPHRIRGPDPQRLGRSTSRTLSRWAWPQFLAGAPHPAAAWPGLSAQSPPPARGSPAGAARSRPSSSGRSTVRAAAKPRPWPPLPPRHPPPRARRQPPAVCCSLAGRRTRARTRMARTFTHGTHSVGRERANGAGDELLGRLCGRRWPLRDK